MNRLSHMPKVPSRVRGRVNHPDIVFPPIVFELGEYLVFLRDYFKKKILKLARRFEGGKDAVVDVLYRKRGKYARPFVHTGMVSILVLMITIGPLILTQSVFSSDLSQGTLPSSVVLGMSTMDSTFAMDTATGAEVERYRGGEVVEYEVATGDTVSSIAEKFNISTETVLWANDLDAKSTIKPGQKLKILPVTGIVHTVKKGETIYSIAKKYGLDDGSGAQAIVDYPFNEFVNDEKFSLAVGQTVVVPGGVRPQENKPAAPTFARVLTPDAGAVSAAGSFVWPASGRITQGYTFYHRAIDIANKGGGPILASDAGKVIVAGWPDNYGYGNRVMIDHGNGYITLYAHLSRIRVEAGQSVNRGDVIGDMGSTGRSTGTHLHYEIRKSGVGLENPLNYLK